MGFGHKVVKSKFVILVISILLLIPSAVGAAKTRVNYDMLTYLPDSMETMKGQKMLSKEFGKGAFSIIVCENMKTGEMRSLRNKIADVKHVDSVLNMEDVIDPSVPMSVYPTEVQKAFKNKNASMMVVFFDSDTSAEPTLNAVSQIRHLCTKDCYVSGMSALVLDLKNMSEGQEAKYIAVAVILSLIAMMLLLDSYVVPIFFLVSIGFAILYNMGTNIFFGEISYITKAIAAVLQLGVTMDYSIFLWHSYTEQLDKGLDNDTAMAEAINATLVSVTGSSVTTIAGFLALCFMTYEMGRDLGLVMAKGCLLGVIVSVTVLPSMLLCFQKLVRRTRHRSLLPDMKKLADGLTKRYAIYIVIFAILIIPAVYGYNNKTVVYDFTKMITSSSKSLSKSDTQFLTANKKLKEDFGISTTHMIIADSNLSGTDGRDMSEAIEAVPGVRNVLGVDALLGPAIPRNMIPDTLEGQLITQKHQLILVNSSYAVSTDQCNQQIDRINRIVHKYDKSATVIGEGPATKDLIQTTDRDFKVVSILSMVAVFFIIFFVLKSAVLPFILIAVIELAIYINLGIPGFTGLELPFIVPVCISTIQLGSTVDYAILMSTRYKTERMSGKSKHESVEIAARTSIPSIMVSALCFFAATFGVSIYSNIGIISTFCQLMARGAIISMLMVILVLPSFFMAFDGIITRTTKGLRKKDLAKAGIHTEEKQVKE
ncbi:MAG: MMPL family transporter [Eubacteriales bacterium]|nr:MMPL family transporter [Eubacteriales bacterium]